jgi:hypothetical protein
MSLTSVAALAPTTTTTTPGAMIPALIISHGVQSLEWAMGFKREEWCSEGPELLVNANGSSEVGKIRPEQPSKQSQT